MSLAVSYMGSPDHEDITATLVKMGGLGLPKAPWRICITKCGSEK
jgi:hypothetical protein